MKKIVNTAADNNSAAEFEKLENQLKAAAEAKADAMDAVNKLTSESTPDEKKSADEALDSAEIALKSAQKLVDEFDGSEPDGQEVAVRALNHLTGKYLLPHDPGVEFKINKSQAIVMVEAGDAEYVNKK